MPKFTFQKGYNKISEYKIARDQIFIGRDPSCDISIDDGDVSRRHARVSAERNKFYIEDLGSSNGTFVNSRPIEGKVELKHTDIVQIGSNVFVFNDMDIPVEMLERGPRTGQKTSEFYTFDFLTRTTREIEQNINKVFKGKREVVRNIILCLMADGHILIEDAPGVGKSLLAQALAKSIQGAYKRIQFTPDMLPSDITGASIFDEQKKEFIFVPGPIFGNIILADEINRTTPRTQSSLLECMSESSITIDGKNYVLPKPFFVIATQNPSGYHGTYPLPEPQLDRFMMRISIGYPSAEEEKSILTTQMASHPLNDISYVAKGTDIIQSNALIRMIHVSDPVKEYIVKIVDATRRHPALVQGCSPRSSLALMRMSQSIAAYYGRQYVIPGDIKEMAVPVLAHRLTLKLRAQGEWESASDVIKEILSKTPIDENIGKPT